MTTTATVKWPNGPADHQAPAHATTQEVTITNSLTIFEPAIATANVTMNVTVDSEVKKGALLLVKFKTTGTETLTFGTGIEGVLITGSAGKTRTKLFMYTGTNFDAVGFVELID